MLPEVIRITTFFADVAQDVFPAVVNVRSITEQSFGRSTVTTGSGFIVKSDGLIITSASLIGNHTRFTVRLQDGRDFDGKVVAVEGSTDLGALRINAKDLPTIVLNKDNDTRVGEWVMAYGSPLALKHSITAGIVSNAHRVGSEIGVKKGSQGYLRYLQTDAIINNGNSGGPLVNLAGEVIGINTLVASTGIGFAVPVDYVADFVKKINNKEFIGSNRPWLGIRVLSLTHDINQQLRQKIPDHPPKEQGLFIDGVGKNSPASRAGLEYKDIITKVNGSPAKSPKDIHFALSSSKDVLFTVKRKEKQFEVLVKADEIKRSE